METRLEQALRHVARGREIVAAQRRLVAAIKTRGDDAAGAEYLLRQFEQSLAMFKSDLDELLNEHGSR